MIASGIRSSFTCHVAEKYDWLQLQHWLDQNTGYKFGWIGYAAGNDFGGIKLAQDTRDTFPQLFFFVPENLVITDGKTVEVLSGEMANDCAEWISMDQQNDNMPVVLTNETTRDEYLSDVARLKHHIQIGDIYEVNYCQVFSAKTTLNDPLSLWKKLYRLTESPHAAYAEHQQWHILCASPERFLSREGDAVRSQPIKGTIRRGTDPEEDDQLKKQLLESKKERSENVMIVDLVRNDLSRFATRGSVSVDELFGVHTFKTVHHLISTVSCTAQPSVTFTNIMAATFPMGSMTGAPKKSAMHLIHDFEKSARGIYSGSIGYLSPNGDFDFNVVIRSLLYDSQTDRLCAGVGSAITAGCDPAYEYEECMLKANALFRALNP